MLHVCGCFHFFNCAFPFVYRSAAHHKYRQRIGIVCIFTVYSMDFRCVLINIYIFFVVVWLESERVFRFCLSFRLRIHHHHFILCALSSPFHGCKLNENTRRKMIMQKEVEICKVYKSELVP